MKSLGGCKRVKLLVMLPGESESGDEEALILRGRGNREGYGRVGWVEHRLLNETAIGMAIGGGNINVHGKQESRWFGRLERRDMLVL
jgi:hypothetical protein